MKLNTAAKKLFDATKDHVPATALPLLTAYCRAYQEANEAAKQLDTDGRCHTSGNGYYQLHPAFNSWKSAVSLMNALAKTLKLVDTQASAIPDKWRGIA